MLLGETLGVPFVDCSDVLFIDRALAVQVPYDDEQSDIVPHTVSTAQKHGWIWDIGLQSRRGVGYVFSSNHTATDAALEELRAYVGDAASRPAAEGDQDCFRAPADILEGKLRRGGARPEGFWSRSRRPRWC